ncbi:hypothetical protein PAMP_020973 [Pampus punctatissimus]
MLCISVSLRQQQDSFSAQQGHESTATRWERIKPDDDIQQGNNNNNNNSEQVIHLRKNNRRGLHELRPESALFPGEPLPDLSVQKLDETDSNLTPSSLSWTIGDVSTLQRSQPSHSEDGYQRDFTGFHGVQGKILGPESSPHFSKLLAMKPLVQCYNDGMTFTASGEGFTQLLVDREGASPISLSQLPPHCGYSVRTSWNDLEMMVPYDACYVTQENGSYVLPMLWWGSPLKLSCPVQMSTPAPSLSHSVPSVFCSPYGMTVQIYGQEKDIPMLGVIVNGGWAPFVSAECGYLINSQPETLTFFVFFSAPCVTLGDGLELQFLLDQQEYILSCPVNPQVPYIPSFPYSPPSSPGDPQFPYIPDPAPTSPPPSPLPPQTPTQEEKLPDYLHHPYPGFQYPEFPHVYHPDLQSVRSPRPTPGSPPGPQPQQSLYPSGSGKLPYSSGENPYYPSPQATSTPKLPGSQYPSGLYYPIYYPAVTPAPTPATKKLTTTSPLATQLPQTPTSLYYPQYYLQMPYYPDPTAPVTPASTPFPPSPPSPLPSPPKQPVGPFYPPGSYSLNYPYDYIFYQKPGLDMQPPSTSPSPTTTRTMVPKQPSYPSSQFYPQWPNYLLPQQPGAQQATCAPYTHTICSYYPYPHHPYYHSLYPPHYPPVSQDPKIEPAVPVITQTPTTSSTTSTPTQPTPESPQLHCLMGRMVVFLPFAHPDSIQVRDQKKEWIFLSSVSRLCGYMIQMAETSGVIFYSPLPACHSQLQTSTTISLPLRFWDISMGQYRTLDLHCPYQSTPETSAPVTPSASPTTKGQMNPSVGGKVLCSSQLMTVELPPGPISAIAVKDLKGNQMNVQDAPKHCGYSASEGKDGKIFLSLQLHSRCHMSVQGKMYIIAVVYMTVNGRKEAQFSCPVSISMSGQECNLPSEQRLPCGHGSVSQPQCLSMGCCFSKHPPACHYPMDECTIDRHFVFSVPASLTEPPLSPALLVAAGDSTCKPQKVTSDYALFKIPMDGCGARRMEVGKTVIYMVEVINMLQAISLNYGTITRDSPVRLLVECRYMPDTVLTVSYLVKTPTLGPAVQTQGRFGVQLRIAKDAHYSSYHPQYHQPLQMLLGKPLYLEVRLLNTPDPSLVLLVHYCVAYPRSGKAVWVLLYNGCPNPLDPAPQQAVVSDPQPPFPHAQTRRFTINTFQFLPDGEFKDLDEEIYFMCSTEICSPRDGPCVEGCFGQ